MLKLILAMSFVHKGHIAAIHLNRYISASFNYYCEPCLTELMIAFRFIKKSLQTYKASTPSEENSKKMIDAREGLRNKLAAVIGQKPVSNSTSRSEPSQLSGKQPSKKQNNGEGSIIIKDKPEKQVKSKKLRGTVILREQKKAEKITDPVSSRKEKALRLAQILKESRRPMQKSVLTTFDCDICGKKFTTYEYMKRHRLIHERSPTHDTFYEDETQLEETIFCTECSEPFDSPSLLQSHFLENHMKIKLETEDDAINIKEEPNL